MANSTFLVTETFAFPSIEQRDTAASRLSNLFGYHGHRAADGRAELEVTYQEWHRLGVHLVASSCFGEQAK